MHRMGRNWAIFTFLAIAVSAIVLGMIWDRTRIESSEIGNSESLYKSNGPRMPESKAVSIIGDSFTGGSPQGGYDIAGWPSLTYRRLYTPDSPIFFVTSAKGGSGYVNQGPSRTTFVTEAERVVNQYTDLVVFFGSQSDVNEIGQVEQSVRDAISVVRKNAPQAKILIIGPAWTRGELTPEIRKVQEAVGDAARLPGVQYVDPISEGWFFGREGDLVGADGVQPNDAGHLYMADRIEPLIRAMLEP